MLKVLLRLGRLFSTEAGFAQRTFELPAGATAALLLREVAHAAPGLSCVVEGSVDLALANLSINGRSIDARSPDAVKLHDGDEGYLYGVISGG